MSKIAELEIFKIHANFCSGLANDKRLRILFLLKNREYSVGELAEELELSVTNVSQHLRVLKNINAVAERKEGQHVFYRITSLKFIEGCAMIREGIFETHAIQTSVFQKGTNLGKSK